MKRLKERLRAALADPNPIVVKELRSIFRTKLYIRFLYLSTFAISTLVLLIGATVVDGSVTPANAGRVIFQTFFTLALAVLTLVGPVYGASSITSEREASTYESLLLTGMDPARIVVGKFVAAFASLALVLVALAPISGVVFLFGGVAPTHVLVAFGGVLVALLPAVAYGVAVSAHVPTSRLAILVSLATWPPLVFFGTIFFTVFGAEVQSEWELTLVGPFWFTEALVERGTSLDTLFGVGVLPLYLVAVTVWFCLAAAIAGVRPPAEDRSSPLKFWALGSAVGPITLAAVGPTLMVPSDARGAFATLMVMLFGALYFYANVFVNEPPLPPRTPRVEGGPLRRGLRLAFGPGARPTMRFASLFVSALLACVVAAYLSSASLVSGVSAEEALGYTSVACAMLAFTVFLLALGTLVRVRTRSGIASRAVLFGTVAALFVVPTMTALILDARSLDRLDYEIPLVLSLSPMTPLAGAVLVAERRFTDVWLMWPFAAFYLVLGLGCYAAASQRIRVIIHEVESARAALMRRAEAPGPATSEPPPRRASVPPPADVPLDVEGREA